MSGNEPAVTEKERKKEEEVQIKRSGQKVEKCSSSLGYNATTVSFTGIHCSRLSRYYTLTVLWLLFNLCFHSFCTSHPLLTSLIIRKVGELVRGSGDWEKSGEICSCEIVLFWKMKKILSLDSAFKGIYRTPHVVALVLKYLSVNGHKLHFCVSDT